MLKPLTLWNKPSCLSPLGIHPPTFSGECTIYSVQQNPIYSCLFLVTLHLRNVFNTVLRFTLNVQAETEKGNLSYPCLK